MFESSRSLDKDSLQKRFKEIIARMDLIHTPPDMKSFVEATARLVAKKGLEFEDILRKKSSRANFLRNSEDPFHGYYQQKLTEYLSQDIIQEEDDVVVVASTGVTEPPPDMATTIVRTARIVAECGMEFDNKDHIKNPNLCFLSSSHPFHGFYQQKLNQFLSQINREEDGVVASTEIIEPPPGGVLRTMIEGAARYLSKKGLQAESLMMAGNAHNPKYSFMKRSDPFHAFYRHKLSEYRSHQNQQEDGADQDTATHEDEGFPLEHSQAILLPDLLEIRLPKGMDINEFVTLKLTAQFAAWYGYPFWVPLMERAGFEFTDPSDSRFPRFSQFVAEYSKVVPPRRDLERKLLESDAYKAAIHDGFFRLVQWDSLQEFKWRHGGVKAMIDWHASVEKDFYANKVSDDEELPPPETGTSTHAPLPLHEEEPEPKRQKLDEPALVPEDQFLAQHPGSSTIMVSVVNVHGGGLVIETTVESLSENVASLKEKIAGEIQIPADGQSLIGKAGVLEDDRSLAHYNVGPGENLTLSLSEEDVV